VKVGVGAKPHPDYDLADWVLSKFSAQEEKDLGPALENAAKAALMVMDQGIDKAASAYNGK
jgi:PTH1 family peptidyl-tRNA hydrolase